MANLGGVGKKFPEHKDFKKLPQLHLSTYFLIFIIVFILAQTSTYFFYIFIFSMRHTHLPVELIRKKSLPRFDLLSDS